LVSATPTRGESEPIMNTAAKARRAAKAAAKKKTRAKRLLSRREVMAAVNLSYPTIWAMMRAGTFPRARAIGNLKVCWLESEIDDWIYSLPVKALKGDQIPTD
jgi:prophage regulatory protein